MESSNKNEIAIGGFRNFAKIKSVVEEQPLYREQRNSRGFGLRF